MDHLYSLTPLVLVYVYNSHSQMDSEWLEVLPEWQTAVCHLDVALLSATVRTSSRLKWRKSTLRRTRWGNKRHILLNCTHASLSVRHCGNDVQINRRTHTRWILDSLPMTGIKGNSARHRQLKSQANVRNYTYAKILKFRHCGKLTVLTDWSRVQKNPRSQFKREIIKLFHWFIYLDSK